MKKINPIVIFSAFIMLIISFSIAQDKKSTGSPTPAKSLSQELLQGWNGVGNKLIQMAEDFPEEKYNFKAQKDERTFGENLLHVANAFNFTINSIKGSQVGFTGTDDSLRKKYPTKSEIVNFLRKSVADGARLIEDEGDKAFASEFRWWGNRMAHISYGLFGMIEHAGEHYGQLVVYYRLNGLVPPQSRPK